MNIQVPMDPKLELKWASDYDHDPEHISIYNELKRVLLKGAFSSLKKFIREEIEVADHLRALEEDEDDESYDCGFYSGRAEQCRRIFSKLKELEQL